MKAIVTGDAEYVAHSFDDLPPGAHVAVRASPTELPDSGLALRLAGFEIRDTIAHIVGDRIVWWVLARKPLDGTVAANVLAHGVGGLNIDASRVGTSENLQRPFGTPSDHVGQLKGIPRGELNPASSLGRFPANVLLDEHAAKEMDRQSGWQKDAITVNRNRAVGGSWCDASSWDKPKQRGPNQTYGGSGGASRFFPLLDEDGAENWIRRLIDPDQSQ